MNRFLEEADVPEWMTNGKTTQIQNEHLKGTTLSQSHNYNMENTNGINKGSDLRLSNQLRIVPRGTERIPQRIKRHRRANIQWSAHSQWEQDETEKCSYAKDWLQNAYGVVPKNWIKKLPQNIPDIKWSHELYRQNNENVEREMTRGGKRLAEAKIQRAIVQGDAQSTLLFIIAMMLYKRSKPQKNINHLMYMDGIKQFAHNETEL